jgi:hypothetical protein
MSMWPRLRKLALTVHITASVAWLGAVACFLALALAGLGRREPEAVRAAYVAMDVTTRAVIVPLCWAALVTGVVQSLVTPWGLFRHYWVIAKLFLTLVAAGVLLLHTGPVKLMADAVVETPHLPRELRRVQVQLVIVSAGGLGVLFVTTILSVYKPRGLTPYGFRKRRT